MLDIEVDGRTWVVDLKNEAAAGVYEGPEAAARLRRADVRVTLAERDLVALTAKEVRDQSSAVQGR